MDVSRPWAPLSCFSPSLISAGIFIVLIAFAFLSTATHFIFLVSPAKCRARCAAVLRLCADTKEGNGVPEDPIFSARNRKLVSVSKIWREGQPQDGTQ
eukprot:226453-Amorphochlora_amoeboformis.AAC.1